MQLAQAGDPERILSRNHPWEIFNEIHKSNGVIKAFNLSGLSSYSSDKLESKAIQSQVAIAAAEGGPSVVSFGSMSGSNDKSGQHHILEYDNGDPLKNQQDGRKIIHFCLNLET